MTSISDDEYEIPLRDQRYFGAGLKRKRIRFVPSSSGAVTADGLPTSSAQAVAEQYLSIVLKKGDFGERPASVPPEGRVEDVGRDGDKTVEDSPPTTECEICHQRVPTEGFTRHESSLKHQIALRHSHPPSHFDRRRKGLAVLETQGWDPDSRRGLGAAGEGILYPIKAKENPDRAGLGVRPEDLEVKSVEKPIRLDAGRVKSLQQKQRQQGAKLREAFYRSEDVEKYLGNGEVNKTLDMDAFKRAKRR